MWLYVSIFLIGVVLVFVTLFIVFFIRQRRILRKALCRTLNRNISVRSSASENKYENPGFESTSVEDKGKTRTTDTEDIGVQTSPSSISRRRNSNCESGFESYPGSLLDRKRNGNVYESGIGSVVGSVKETIRTEDEYSVVHEKQIIFRSHQRRISEEETTKEEIEFQKRESAVMLNIPDLNILAGIRNFNKDVEALSTDENSLLEEDYENVELLRSLKKEEINNEEQSARNLENPTYGFVGSVKGEKETDYSDQEEEENVENENSLDDGHNDAHLYLNTGNLREEYLSNLKSQSNTAKLNFLNLNWDYRCDIDNNGGLIKAPNSEISLCLPENFIIDVPATSIFWSIFTQDSEIKLRTDFDSCIVSPIVEYYTPYKDIFHEYVIIELPHCISEYSDDLIKTYWFNPDSTMRNGKIQIQEIPKLNIEDISRNIPRPDAFFVKNRPGFVSIYTRHFSVYFCACSKSFPLELYAVTFGKYVPIDHSQVNIKIKVHIADAKITLTDYIQKLKDDEQSLGFTFKGKTEIDLDENVTGSDSIEIKVDFEDVPRNMNPVWKHSVDKEGFLIHPITKTWALGNRYKCESHKFIQTTKEWQFKNESPPRYRTVFQCFIEILHKKIRGSVDGQIDLSLENKSLLATARYEAMGTNGVDTFVQTGANSVEYSEKQGSSNVKNSDIKHNEEYECLRTRMTVDIDLSDTVIEDQYSDSMDELHSFSSRRGILPSIIYEIIDALDDEKFDEMCRRLGADRELRLFKNRSEDSLTRGKKYELLDNIRDAMADGKFCKETITVLLTMKENKLRQSITEHIKKATQTNRHSLINVEPQSGNFQRLIPVQNEDTHYQHHREYSIGEETEEKVAI